MPRIKLELPNQWIDNISVPIRVSDINYAGHVGNENMLSILQEARTSFFLGLGFEKLNTTEMGIVLSDVAMVFKRECFFEDQLEIQLGTKDWNRYGFDLFYQVIKNKEFEKPAILAKTGICFFNYTEKKIQEIPTEFKTVYTSKYGNQPN